MEKPVRAYKYLRTAQQCFYISQNAPEKTIIAVIVL
jgi:hypothetical protein